MNRLTKALPKQLTAKVGRQILRSKKHSPTILFASGVVGVVATAVMASKATLDAPPIIHTAKHELEQVRQATEIGASDKHPNLHYTDENRAKDLVIVYSRAGIALAKLYAPTVGVGILTIAALTGSHKILSQRNAGLAAAYAVLDKAFSEYRHRVIEDVGDEKDQHYRYGAEKQRVTQKGTSNEVDVMRVSPNAPSGYARFFDEYSSSWSKTPEYNLIFLRCQQNFANDKLQARGHIFLNEVYDMLGIERSSAGSVVGWTISKTGDNYIDFGIFNKDNPRARDFVNGREGAILLDFNVDGVIYDKI